jgi:hypothetical protein
MSDDAQTVVVLLTLIVWHSGRMKFLRYSCSMKVRSSGTPLVLSVIIIFTGSLLPAYSQDLLPELFRRSN